MFFNFSFSYRAEFKWELFKFLFNQCFYYQFIHVFYMQLYFMSIYFLFNEWSSQDYNSYWKSKSNQTNQSVDKLTDQSQLSASKQSLMITAGAAAMSESQSVYSSFKWEVNFCHNQNQYKHVIRNQLQSFYSTWLYHVVKDFNFDNKNIYHVNSDQI